VAGVHEDNTHTLKHTHTHTHSHTHTRIITFKVEAKCRLQRSLLQWSAAELRTASRGAAGVTRRAAAQRVASAGRSSRRRREFRRVLPHPRSLPHEGPRPSSCKYTTVLEKIILFSSPPPPLLYLNGWHSMTLWSPSYRRGHVTRYLFLFVKCPIL